MKTLQESLDEIIKENLRFEKLSTQFVCKRLNKLGIQLTKNQVKRIESQFKNLTNDVFHLELNDEQIIKAGFKSKKKFHETLSDILGDLETNIEKFMDDFIENLPSMIENVSLKISEDLLKTLKRNSKRMLKEHLEEKNSFESKLYEVWGRAFDLLEMFIVIALEAGESFNEDFRRIASGNKNFVFEVLTRLHARGCQIAYEILCLLKSGYADGAHARWRSLHEIAVVADIIGTYGNKMAECYLLHDTIESYKAAIDYQKYCKKLGYEPLTEKELFEMKKNYNDLIERFGKNFKNEYGWASNFIGINKPTFKDMEIASGLDYLRPYYRMACHNVHANPRGIFFKLGILPEYGDILLAGPSNIGLADPGHSTSLSLGQLTIFLLTHESNIDNIIICKILLSLEEEIGNTFLEADQTTKTH